MTRTNKKVKITALTITILIAVLIPVSIIIVIWRANSYFELSYKPTTLTQVEYEIKRPDNISYENIESELNDLLDYTDYKLIKTQFSGCYCGEANLISKTIKIDSNLDYEYYTFTLTHEIIHLKYFTTNDRFANYEAFKVLYQSGNEYFKNVALYVLNLDLSNAFSYDYKFSGYAEELIRIA